MPSSGPANVVIPVARDIQRSSDSGVVVSSGLRPHLGLSIFKDTGCFPCASLSAHFLDPSPSDQLKTLKPKSGIVTASIARLVFYRSPPIIRTIRARPYLNRGYRRAAAASMDRDRGQAVRKVVAGFYIGGVVRIGLEPGR